MRRCLSCRSDRREGGKSSAAWVPEMFACSGPGAPAAIARSVEIGYTHAGIAGGLLLASVALLAVARRGWAFPAILLGLLVIHPAWTISVIDGDCGYLRRDASWVVTVVGALTIFFQVAFSAWVIVRRAQPDAAGDYDESPEGSVKDGRGGIEPGD